MGCRNVFIGCGIFALLSAMALGVAGFWAYQKFGPSVQAYIGFAQKVEATMQGVSNVNTNLRNENGRTFLDVQVQVPFNPNDLKAEQAAQEIAKLAKQLPNPANLKVPELEIRLYQVSGNSKTERIFKFDLTKAIPKLEAPKL